MQSTVFVGGNLKKIYDMVLAYVCHNDGSMLNNDACSFYILISLTICKSYLAAFPLPSNIPRLSMYLHIVVSIMCFCAQALGQGE